MAAAASTIPEHAVFAERRLQSPERLDHAVDVPRVKRDEVTAQQHDVGARVRERGEHTVEQVAMERGSCVKVGGERDAQRRRIGTRSRNAEHVFAQLQLALQSDRARDHRWPAAHV